MMPAARIGIHEHLHGPDRQADHAEQRHVDDQHQADALPAEARVHIALDPVAPGVPWPNLSMVSLFWLRAIQLRASSSTLRMPRVCRLCGSSSVSHLAWCLRWMAVHSLVTMPVVSHSQKRKKCLRNRVQIQRPVRHAAVQENGHAGDRDMRHHEGVDARSPTRTSWQGRWRPSQELSRTNCSPSVNRRSCSAARWCGTANAQKKTAKSGDCDYYWRLAQPVSVDSMGAGRRHEPLQSGGCLMWGCGLLCRRASTRYSTGLGASEHPLFPGF